VIVLIAESTSPQPSPLRRWRKAASENFYSMSDSRNDSLHSHAIGKLYEYAREMRKKDTVAESFLWRFIRNRKLDGLKFRRQHPLDKFIADFYCHEKRLVVEVDGGVHNDKEAKESDEGRTFELKELGIIVIRFTNKEVQHKINDVLKIISEIAMKIDDKK
jgi:very-short-patch-repair endonuclease